MAGVSELEGLPFEYSGQSLWNKFVTSAESWPNNIAVVCTHQPKGHLDLPNTDLDDEQFRRKPYLRLQYRAFADAVNRWTNALLARGVRPDTPIFSFMPNLVECGIAMWSAAKLGCIWVPINPRNLLNKQEAIHMIKTALSWKSSQSAWILAGDAKIASQFDELDIQCRLTRVIVNGERKDSWENFPDVFHSAPTSHPQNPAFAAELGEGSSVLFTSGTTSLPKGVGAPIDRFALMLETRVLKKPRSPGDAICVVAPNNHAIGLVWGLFAHTSGAAVVHPGAAFDPQHMMDTLLRESCTETGLVPTMVYALLAAKSTGGARIPSLRNVGLGGANVSPAIIDICVNEFGCKEVDNVWGMTEGCVTVTNGEPFENFVKDDLVSVGYPTPGARVRVCPPDSTVPVPIGQSGELHCSGGSLASGYIGKKSSDFYDDPSDGRRWFKTGDQAMIDERGRIFINGRFKEMIIRGGENISPNAIESVLMKIPEMVPFNVQIVGAKDTVAGEVPVAVYIGQTNPKAAQSIQQNVLSLIGPACVPDQVIALKELGLDDYPRTMAGKIQKNKLTDLVQSFRDKQAQSVQNGMLSNDELAQTVRKIWTRSLGYEVDETLSFASFADSITIMKTRDMIAKETGKQITLAEMVDANNIAGQIKMLQDRPRETSAPVRRPKRKDRTTPLTPNDSVVFRHKSAAFEGAKAFIESMLASYKYSWDDVADITPAYDFSTILNQTGIMDSWSFTIANMTGQSDPELVRSAMRRTLANNPVFSSFFIWNQKAFKTDSALHVIMCQTDEYLNQRIHDHKPVKTIADFKAMTEAYPDPSAAILPGPLFDAYLVPVEENQRVGILMRLHHAIVDASCALIFSDDLEATLGGKSPPEHIDYKIWTDSYYSLRTSLEAQVAVNWHVNRLKGVASHRKAFWVHSSTDNARQEGIRSSFDVPSILKLRRTHPGISAPVILKSAFSLVSAYHSKHTHALFCNHQASRERFPFVPSALSADLGYDYSAANVAGPTIETVINLVQINPDETVLSFLSRMQDDQDNLTKYAAAPMGDIIKSLGDTDGPMVLETIWNTTFNWVPGLGSQSPNKYDNMQMLAASVKPEIAFCLNAGLGGEKGCTMIIDLLGTVMSQEEHRFVAKEIEEVVGWMCDEANWDVNVGGYTESLKRVTGYGDGVNGHA